MAQPAVPWRWSGRSTGTVLGAAREAALPLRAAFIGGPLNLGDTTPHVQRRVKPRTKFIGGKRALCGLVRVVGFVTITHRPPKGGIWKSLR